jgi:Zn-finger nucleic acid-binding protein
MEKVVHHEIEIDRCTNCYGLWFDLLELLIDIGDSGVGKLYDNMKEVNCPQCGARMIKMVDRRQPHLSYEACTVCYGVFFDAGEFRDYKEQGVLDFFRDLRLMRRRSSTP